MTLTTGHYVAFGTISTIAIIFILRMAFLKDSAERKTQMAYAAIGALVGFLIGMSESPLVAGAVTSGLALAGILVGKTWDQSTTKTENKSEVKTDTKTDIKTVTRTEKSPGQLTTSWLLPVAVALFIGVIAGATVRINHLLDIEDHSIPVKLRTLGFEEDQIKAMMKRYSETFVPGKLESIIASGQAGLQAREVAVPDRRNTLGSEEDIVEQFDWSEFWKTMDGIDIATEQGAVYVLNTILDESNKGGVPGAIRNVLNAKKPSKNPVEIVRILKEFTWTKK